MNFFANLHNLITGIQRVLRDMRGSMDSELRDAPQQALDSFARLLLPKIQAFFESPEGKQEFEQWQRQQVDLLAKQSKGGAV